MWRHIAPVREKMRRGSTRARAMAGPLSLKPQTSSLGWKKHGKSDESFFHGQVPEHAVESNEHFTWDQVMTGGWGKVLPRTSLRHTESLLITENGFQKSKKQATDSGKGYQKDSCLGKHSLTRARMTDYMRQDLLREE